MEAIFSTAPCDRCGYKYATYNVAKDKSNDFFLCHRCGFQRTSSNGEGMEIQGVGAYAFVSKNGIACGGAFEKQETFFEKTGELLEAIKGAKLFYTERGEKNGKYYLINFNTKQQYEFGEDDIICLEGVKKAEPTSKLKVTFSKKGKKS